VRLFAHVIRQRDLKLRLVGVGGIATAAHVRAHLDAGASGVQLATAAMLDPQVGLAIRAVLAGTAGMGATSILGTTSVPATTT